MGAKDIFFILSLAMPLAPIGIAKQWWLFAAFAGFYVLLIILEILAVKRNGKTISKRFWEFSERKEGMAWVILGVMSLMWVALIWHLAIRII